MSEAGLMVKKSQSASGGPGEEIAQAKIFEWDLSVEGALDLGTSGFGELGGKRILVL
jgi:hypothetical protein